MSREPPSVLPVLHLHKSGLQCTDFCPPPTLPAASQESRVPGRLELTCHRDHVVAHTQSHSEPVLWNHADPWRLPRRGHTCRASRASLWSEASAVIMWRGEFA